MSLWIVIVGIVLIAVVYVALPVGLAMSAHFRRWKIVDCPAAYRPTAILVGRAGLAEALGIRSLRRILGCSLWPERYGCDRRCLAVPEAEIHDAPTVSIPSRADVSLPSSAGSPRVARAAVGRGLVPRRRPRAFFEAGGAQAPALRRDR